MSAAYHDPRRNATRSIHRELALARRFGQSLEPLTKKPRSAPAPLPDPLARSVDQLAAELRNLRQAIDDVRADFAELISPGPMSSSSNRSPSPLNSTALDRIALDLESTLKVLTRRHLRDALAALDTVRDEIVRAIAPNPGSPPNAPLPPPIAARPARPGHLF